MSDQLVKGFLARMNSLQPENISSVLADTYTTQATFIDPVKKIQGLDKLIVYFTELYTGVEHCQFRLNHALKQDQQYALDWQMILRHKQLAKHRDIVVDGVSMLHFVDGKVDYQRDYYDLGAMIYEQIPILGHIVKKIRHGL